MYVICIMFPQIFVCGGDSAWMLALFCMGLYAFTNSLSISLSYFAFVEKCIGILTVLTV